MKTVKQPKWDRQDGAPVILTGPDSLNKNPSFTEPLRAGQQAIGTIGGIEVAVLLTEIMTTASAQGEIVGIVDGQTNRDSLGDLSVGDTVLIKRSDMYSLDVDTDLSSLGGFF